MFNQRYKIKHLIGEGGSSTVYKAVDTQLSKEVAIKAYGSHSTLEHNILKGISHENIVSLLDAHHAKTASYLVFELCDCNLLSFLNSYDLDMKCIKRIFRMVLLGLKHIHDNNIIHRDIKMGNILISGDIVKICDFGLSCYADTNDYAYCGTKDYLAPEILRNADSHFYTNISAHSNATSPKNSIKEPYNNKIDIYSAGIVFKILVAKRKDARIADLNDIDPKVVLFLQRMIECNPQIRYSAEEALKDPIFDELISQIPDFRLIKNFRKFSKFSDQKREIMRDLNFIQIKYGHEMIRIEHKQSLCNCKGDFIPVVKIKVDGVFSIVDVRFITTTQLKNFNYLCSYFHLIADKTLKYTLESNGYTFKYMINGTYTYSNQHYKIEKTRQGYIVNNVRNACAPPEFSGAVRELERRCKLQTECVCIATDGNENFSTINISMGDSILHKEYEHIKKYGWCIKDHSKYTFLMNDGSRFSILANEQVLVVENRRILIEKTMSQDCKEKLRISKEFLVKFM
jgi:serine/threonine protein kinase